MGNIKNGVWLVPNLDLLSVFLIKPNVCRTNSALNPRLLSVFSCQFEQRGTFAYNPDNIAVLEHA